MVGAARATQMLAEGRRRDARAGRSGERVFSALLRLLPGEFRGDYGDAMAADVDERRA